jgi:Raf kinase inhibitor-like YbhB/YbcL family protein
MKLMRVVMVLAMIVAVTIGMAVAQAPAGGQGGGQRGPGAGGAPGGAPGGGRQGAGGAGGRGQRGPAFTVTSTAWPDGGEVPMKHAGRGENKSPAFEFAWYQGTEKTDQPATVQSFAVIFHDIENSTNRGTADTLHWSAFNIPGTAKGLPEGLGGGDLPDGTRNGPGINARGGAPGSYFGPGAGPGPFHHYVFEFYALDTKIDLPGTATREQLLAAMEGHVVGKAAYVGRFHGQ